MNSLHNSIGGVDIYLLDQILKNRYIKKQKILDAGCGSGRNLKWFYDNSFSVFGIDSKESSIEQVQKKYPNQQQNFSVSYLDELDFKDAFFDHIICNAVLHFAKNSEHFNNMFKELIRVLKPGGSMFIRVASDIGLENFIKHKGNGVYSLPDGTDRFLFKIATLNHLLKTYPIKLIEPLKTVNVQNTRCMSTLVIQKVVL